ncbi:hypothetical protein MM817_01221 [Acidibacillus sp. S0AB]|uniref:Uncharacterized protein n=1 Tax=Sulfoacidibacillus ferrooxidans TaxID=2005001 RepID=A0A9X2AE45_9BACL|nr:hypothetical protein [Sulfoacidibacillus ferrooxidans]
MNTQLFTANQGLFGMGLEVLRLFFKKIAILIKV